MRTLNLNTSYKYHFLIALLISLWLVIFLILIAPFDIAELPFKIRLEILPLYGLFSFFSYIFLIPFQNLIIKKFKKWTIVFEACFVILFSTLALIGSFFYYRSNIIKGNHNLKEFALEVYFPIFLVLLTVLIFARWFLNRKSHQQTKKKIILKGDNKLDILQINHSDLVSISSADNYVEVSYLKDNVLCKKLLRNTLKNIETEEPRLLKVHRSHLINPMHIIEWKNSKILNLTQMEVPVSKNYKDAILAISNPSLKMNNSPQTH